MFSFLRFVYIKVLVQYLIDGVRKGLLTWVITTSDERHVAHFILPVLTYKLFMRLKIFKSLICIFKENGRNLMY